MPVFLQSLIKYENSNCSQKPTLSHSSLYSVNCWQSSSLLTWLSFSFTSFSIVSRSWQSKPFTSSIAYLKYRWTHQTLYTLRGSRSLLSKAREDLAALEDYKEVRADSPRQGRTVLPSRTTRNSELTLRGKGGPCCPRGLQICRSWLSEAREDRAALEDYKEVRTDSPRQGRTLLPSRTTRKSELTLRGKGGPCCPRGLRGSQSWLSEAREDLAAL